MTRRAVAGAGFAALALVAIAVGAVVSLIHAVEETLTSADLIPWDDQD
jgi:hypothetical protein